MNLKDYEKIKDLPETTDATDALSKKEKKDKYLLLALAEENPARLAYDKLLYAESSNPEFIMAVISNNKEAINYMAESLKQDEKFLTDVVKRYPHVVKDILKNCNVRILESGKVVIAQERFDIESRLYAYYNDTGAIPAQYMSNEKMLTALIAKDATAILVVSETLKNDKEFIKVQTAKNDETLDVISQHVDQFGVEALTGAKEVNMEKSSSEFIDKLENNLKEMVSELREKGLSDEEIKSDVLVKGIKSSLDRLKGFDEKDEGERADLWDKYLKNMAEENDELTPQSIMRRANIQDSICKGIEKKQSLNKEDEVMEL